ncbi:MAG: hypothetical protein KatS3mg115_2256 [Candidatus Poribacteria bacterium]|nr:MAG: hypothetical protein KatS3mg115_2256 [Candidatus Poribacteria bacterium]
MLSDFFTDYAGILRLEGSYRQGSFAQASRLWNLFGPQALEDLLGLPDREHREYARVRLRELGAWQQRARGTFAHGAALSDRAPDTLLLDGARMMEMWTAYFQARLALVEALQEAAERKTEQIGPRLDVAREQIARALEALRLIQGYQPLLGADRVTIKLRLLEPVQAELAQLQALGPEEASCPRPRRGAPGRRRTKSDPRREAGGLGPDGGVFCLRTSGGASGGTFLVQLSRTDPGRSALPLLGGGALSQALRAAAWSRWPLRDRMERNGPGGEEDFRTGSISSDFGCSGTRGRTVYVGRFGALAVGRGRA